MSELHRYFDGRTARPRKVTLAIGPTGIAIRDEDGVPLANWPYSHMRVADQNAVSGAYVLRLEPDAAARLEVAAGVELETLLAQRPELRRWRARARTGLAPAFAKWGAGGAATCAGLPLSAFTRGSTVEAMPAWRTRMVRGWPLSSTCPRNTCIHAYRPSSSSCFTCPPASSDERKILAF